MRYQSVRIEGFGYELPPKVVPSNEIERRLKPLYDRLKMSIGRLELMTGIRERRFWPERQPPSTYSIRAAQKCIAATGIDPSRIGALIHASVSRDFLEPATASFVHHKLGLRPDAFVFDISNACLGVMNGMSVVANMIELGQIEAGLVVAAEDGKTLMDSTIHTLLNTVGLTRKKTKSSLASLTIGSGAVAVLLTKESISKTDHRLLGGVVMSDTAQNELCRSVPDRGFATETDNVIMHTDSETMLIEGCKLAARAFEKFLDTMDWTVDSIDRVVTHQVGKAHRKTLLESVGLDPDKDIPTVEWLGNVGSVSLPISMAIGIERKDIREGDQVAMLGIGSGMNTIMMGVQW